MSIVEIKDLSPDQIELYSGWMDEALKEARLCEESGDVPVGAVVIFENRIIGRGRNAREKLRSPLWHAEMAACEEAARTLGAWNLSGSSLIVTKEPCVMCAGLIVQARISECVFAVGDAKGGGCGGLMQIARNPGLNHRARLVRGIMEAECLELIRDFFRRKRQ